MSAEQQPPSEGQWVPALCECGGGSYLKHYGICRCECGAVFWALRPKRNGPLVAFPWPGRNLTREEMKERGETA